MSKYIINFAIGLAIIIPPVAFLILFAAYPAVGYLVLLPLLGWGCYQIGTVVKEMWKDRRANHSTRV